MRELTLCQQKEAWPRNHLGKELAPSIPVWQGEGGVDPAVGVHDAGGDVVDDAVDGVPDEGLRGDEEVGGEDEEHRRLAVQLENRVVDSDLDNWPGVSSDSD